LTIQNIAEKINTHTEIVTLILTKDLKMKATYAKMAIENVNGRQPGGGGGGGGPARGPST
jgi:hypothetical protein